MKNEFNTQRKGTGTKEWSEHSYNIQKGCPNACIYCYARYNAVKRYKYVKDIEQWQQPIIDEKKVKKQWSKVDGVIMFPTTHDIDRNNVIQCSEVLKNMLKAGNNVLIVSKPDINCINYLIIALMNYKEQIMFRFTIGSTFSGTLEFLEPNAPDLSSRVFSLQAAYNAGYKTSISVEPLLGGIEVLSTICNNLSYYVTDEIWVGKLNGINHRILDNVSQEQKNALEMIKDNQTDEKIIELYEHFKSYPKIKWKDSIKKVINI